MRNSIDFTAPVTRREALRRAVLFSTGAWAASRLGASGLGSVQASEAAAPLAGGMHLLALGDYGTKGNEPQSAVAQQMATFASKLGSPLTAVLALGDNFYNAIDAGRIEREFEALYPQEQLNCPFYVCVGNHDYGTADYDFQVGKLQMEFDYARQHPESRWKLPSKWYSVELPNAENPLVKIIVLDGSFWIGGLTPQEKIAQRRFFKAELKKGTTAPWTWMVNHYPLYSETVDRGDNQDLIREWGDLLNEYDVSLALAGHDHTLQHLEVAGCRPSFIVSGAGGAPLYDCHPSKRGFVNNRVTGFNHLHVTPDLLTVQYIDSAGEQLHAFTRDRAGKVEIVTQRAAVAD